MVLAVARRTIPIYYKREINLGDGAKYKEISNMANTQGRDAGNDQNKFKSPAKQSSSTETEKSGDRFNGGLRSVSTGNTAAGTARSFYDQAKETAGQAYEAATETAATKLDEQKSTLSGGLSTVADSVRQVSDNLGSAKTDSGLAGSAAKYTETAAKRIEDVASYFETKSVRDMARDLESFARRNPAVFLGAAFGLGLLAARFLKSTPTGQFERRGDERGSFDTGRANRSLDSGSTSTDRTSSSASTPNVTPKSI
jgi:hypothetical protein